MLKRFAGTCISIMIAGLMHNAAFAADVVLYSSNDVQTVGNVVEQFQKQNPGIKVSVVRAGTGALMQRIKAEAANPLGDIFWSGGLSTISAFEDLFQPYMSPEASAVPVQYRSPQQLWLGTNIHVTVLMANERQVPGGRLPTTWADLADPKWKGKIVIPDPQFSSASYVALYGMRKVLGDRLFAQVVQNAVIVGTTSAAYQGVAAGEFALAVTMEYAAYQYVAGGMNEVKVIYPSDGTFLSPEGMALIKGAKHPEEARKLFDFLASKQMQISIFKSAFRRPIRADINVNSLSSLPAIDSVKVIPLSDKTMEADRAAFLKQWGQIVASK